VLGTVKFFRPRGIFDPRFNAQAELVLHGRCTFPKPDFLERADEIGDFLSLPCNFRKPFLYEGHPLVIQDEPRQHIKEPRFSEQHPCRLCQITPKI
jgi:hypothetical protein